MSHSMMFIMTCQCVFFRLYFHIIFGIYHLLPPSTARTIACIHNIYLILFYDNIAMARFPPFNHRETRVNQVTKPLSIPMILWTFIIGAIIHEHRQRAVLVAGAHNEGRCRCFASLAYLRKAWPYQHSSSAKRFRYPLFMSDCVKLYKSSTTD